jgi:diguanylate cyclase (GGDEF)-like protein
MSPLAGVPPLASVRERPPRLVLLFALLTALGVAAAGAVILVVVRHADTAQVQRQAIDRAQLVVQGVLRPELRAVDLSSRPGSARTRRLDRLFAERIFLQGVEGARLYGANGRASYAAGAKDEAIAGDRGLVREALGGAVVSEIARSDGGSRVLRTYVPVARASGEVAGVVQLDQAYGPIEESAHRFSWLVAIVLEVLLVVLFVVFVPLLARVSTSIRRQLEQLEHVATHDDLTALANRLGFRRATEELLATAGSGAVLLLDVDGFSEVNETLGAKSADALLLEVADRLRYELDDCVCLARLGEDEFGVLLRDGERAQIDEAGRRIETALSTPILVDGIRLAATMSIGVTVLEPGVDFEVLLARAGTALSLAKGSGNDSLQICGAEVDLRDISRLAFVAELRDALQDGDLVVHYQPQSDLTTRRVRGVEALLRWEHPQDGLLTADKFIRYAERGGLGREIRQLVLESSVAQWQRWHELGLDLELAVNLSPADVLDASLPEDIAELVSRYGMPSWRLILEITERTLISEERRARLVLDRIADLGVRLSLDDFGTGYSSIASLRRFPVQQVKLDRCLLAGVPGDLSAEAIIGGCVEIAHGIGANVVAEGVETREQWQFVSLMGCDVAQGFLVGRPRPADELTVLLNASNHVPLTAV